MPGAELDSKGAAASWGRSFVERATKVAVSLWQAPSLLFSSLGSAINSLESGVSNLRPVGCTCPKMAMNVAQHKTINLIKVS